MTRWRVVLLGLLVGAVLGAAGTPVEGQVLIASRPHSGLVVTPLFLVAHLGSGAGDVPIEIMFSLMIPPEQSALGLEQDLFLLWPGEIVGTDGAGDVSLPAAVAAQVSVVGRGRVRLQAQRHYEASADTEVIATGAPFVSVVRTGGPMGRSPAATYIRIPWNWHLVNQAWLMSVHFVAKDLVKPKPTTWLGRTVSGARYTLTLGFNDVGAPAMFSMYYWQRDNVLPVASPARLVANFARADHLAVDEMFPPAARREASPSQPSTDVVSLFLEPTDALTPQVLRVEFGYFSRLQSWGPILIPALFFALGNAAGALVRGFAERLSRRLGGWLQLGRQRASAAGMDSGTVIPRERLAAIVPGETTYEEVLKLCGTQMEVREDLAMPRRQTLIYRGRRDVPHRQWAWSWLAAVSYWDVERHEVEIAVDDGLVQKIQVRVDRARSTR